MLQRPPTLASSPPSLPSSFRLLRKRRLEFRKRKESSINAGSNVMWDMQLSLKVG